MASEKGSHGRWYYYRAHRIGGRVFKEYLGGPGFGGHAEREDAERRARLTAEREEAERLAEVLDVSERPLAALEAVTSAMVGTAFRTAHASQRWRPGSSAPTTSSDRG